MTQDFLDKLLAPISDPLTKTARDGITAWTRAQIRGDYGTYKFTGRPVRGFSRTILDPVFYEIRESRMVREDLLRRVALRLVGKKEWKEYESRRRRRTYHKQPTAHAEEQVWFDAFAELFATIVAIKQSR